MAAIENIRRNAKSHARFLAAIFVLSSAGSVLFSWLGVWAGHQRGWEGDVIAGVLTLVAGALIVSTFLFGVLLVSWLQNYRYAVRDAADFDKDPDLFRLRYRSVFGPIPWR